MKLYILLLFVVLFNPVIGDAQDIFIYDLKHEYLRSEKVTFSLKSNSEKRIYFHFEGWCYYPNVEPAWREFDNDLLSKVELKQEFNLWLEPKSRLDFSINSIQFLKKFRSLPDSLRFRIRYAYEGNDSAKFIFSHPFIIRK